jgi:hypothetical protein
MSQAAFTPAISGFQTPEGLLLDGFGPRSVGFLLQEAVSEVLVELKRDYWGGVEAYRLAEHLERWVRTGDLRAYTAPAAEVFTALDYYYAQLMLPGDLGRLPAARRRAFQRYFWERGLDSLRANALALLRTLAVTALLPDEWYPQATLERQIKAELNRLRIFREITITPDLGLEPGGLSWMARTTRQAVEALREPLQAGRPRPLRMIRDPHQLSGNRPAIAYASREGKSGMIRLEIHEPDCLCAEHAILVDLVGEKPVVVEHCPPGPDVPLAGLLAEAYQPVMPPPECLTPLQRNRHWRQLTWRLRHRIQRLRRQQRLPQWQV